MSVGGLHPKGVGVVRPLRANPLSLAGLSGYNQPEKATETHFMSLMPPLQYDLKTGFPHLDLIPRDRLTELYTRALQQDAPVQYFADATTGSYPQQQIADWLSGQTGHKLSHADVQLNAGAIPACHTEPMRFQRKLASDLAQIHTACLERADHHQGHVGQPGTADVAQDGASR